MSSLAASIVVPLYNNAATIEQCLHSLLGQTIASQLEIIVVNDGSTDAAAELARRLPITLIEQENRGPASARNTGARVATAPVVVFLDADCIAPPSWAESLLAGFADAQTVAVVGAIESATREPVAQLTQVEIEERYRRLSTAQSIDFFASVAVGIRRQAFLRLGGFREDLRLNEDVELAYRIHRSGGTIVFAPAQRVRHPHPRRWLEYVRMKFLRGVWRMRVYRLYPEKARGDSWTPAGLRIQLPAFCALPAAMAASVLDWPGALWIGGTLVALGVASGMSIVVGGLRRGGFYLAALAVPFLIVRAWALGSAMLWALITMAWPRAWKRH